MSEFDESILQSFLEEAEDWGEQFINLALQIVDTNAPETVVGEIFRGVHSLKGGAGFLAAEEPQLGILGNYCHKLETFLDVVRKGRVEPNSKIRNLIAEGLNVLHDDIERLQKNESIGVHEKLVARFSEEASPIVGIEERDGFLIFRLTKSLHTMGDVEKFTQIIWKRVEQTGPDTRLIFDLAGKYRMSSMALGTIIGVVSRVAKIYMVNPPQFMEIVFRRFRFEDLGIAVKNTLKECTV